MAALLSSVSLEITLFMGRSSYLTGSNSVVVNSKRFIRGLRRRPVAVLHPGGERETRIKSNQTADKSRQTQRDSVRTDSERSSRRQAEETTFHTGAAARNPGHGSKSTAETFYSSVREQLGGLRFEKAQPGDKRLAKVVSIARSRAFREQQGKVLLEGRRLICDALAAGAAPQTLFFSRVERLCELPLDKLRQASLVKVKFEDIKIWSDLVTPQGVIAIFSKPDTSRLSFPKDLRLQTVPLFLICDNVRDPGNLGTILRCAAAAGCDRVLLNKGCVDAWEPKVLRAAMGAHFRLPIFPGLDWNDISEHLPKPVTVHVADNTNKLMVRQDAEAVPQDVEKPGDVGWVCNRGNSSDKHLEEYVESDSDADSNSDDDSDSDDEQSLPYLEPKAYHENWAQRSTALVISGETYGLSSEALQLAEETGGHRLSIPMAPRVESLNSAMTASILLFEGRRQLMNLTQKASRRARSVILR
ncbi:rRNA methyltransferase 3A, mitochondrial [Colossoma macropomum]|uniref:rRNA methyltransferase 3A, mitochondrial n=1 Tax=Colossoma macropomum TaxID=42526 RepID=UPI001864805B|nr:rRNA methyltransferase 3A, mitochondrial [Colossoma macropomum]